MTKAKQLSSKILLCRTIVNFVECFEISDLSDFEDKTSVMHIRFSDNYLRGLCVKLLGNVTRLFD